jgi:hypothetical protein
MRSREARRAGSLRVRKQVNVCNMTATLGPISGGAAPLTGLEQEGVVETHGRHVFLLRRAPLWNALGPLWA